MGDSLGWSMEEGGACCVLIPDTHTHTLCSMGPLHGMEGVCLPKEKLSPVCREMGMLSPGSSNQARTSNTDVRSSV